MRFFLKYIFNFILFEIYVKVVVSGKLTDLLSGQDDEFVILPDLMNN